MRWIPIKKTKPKSDGAVIVFIPLDRKPTITTAFWASGDWVGIDGLMAGRITHWQPIPKPPKIGGR